jgi:hypothetical protein
VEDRRRGRQINLIEAIDEGIVDDVNGTIEDTSTGRKFDVAQALREGLLIESNIPEAIEAGYSSSQHRLSGNANPSGKCKFEFQSSSSKMLIFLETFSQQTKMTHHRFFSHYTLAGRNFKVRIQLD